MLIEESVKLIREFIQSKQSELAKGKNIDDFKNDQTGETLLHRASILGSVSLINELIEKYNASPLSRDNEGKTPLHKAASSGSVAAAAVLVHLCPEARNIADKFGQTPFFKSFDKGFNPEIIKLLATKENMQMLDEDNISSIFTAVVSFIIKYRKNNNKNITDQKDIEAITYLIDLGGDCSLPNHKDDGLSCEDILIKEALESSVQINKTQYKTNTDHYASSLLRAIIEHRKPTNDKNDTEQKSFPTIISPQTFSARKTKGLSSSSLPKAAMEHRKPTNDKNDAEQKNYPIITKSIQVAKNIQEKYLGYNWIKYENKNNDNDKVNLVTRLNSEYDLKICQKEFGYFHPTNKMSVEKTKYGTALTLRDVSIEKIDKYKEQLELSKSGR